MHLSSLAFGWFPIFRTGRWTDASGTARDFSADDLQQMVANHRGDRPVRYVITHAELYSPFAFGFGGELRLYNNELQVRSDFVSDQLYSLLEQGHLLGWSAGLERLDDQSWRVDHLAFLGAEAPAVDGMGPFSRSSNDAHYCAGGVIGLSAENTESLQRLHYSAAAAAAVGQQPDLPAVRGQGLRRGESSLSSPFFNSHSTHSPAPENENDPDPDMDKDQKITELSTALDTRNSEFAALQTAHDRLAQQLSRAEHAALKAQYASEADALVTQAKLLPAEKAAYIDTCVQLASSESGKAEFSAGDKTTSALEQYRASFSARASHALFSEQAAGESAPVMDTRSNARKIQAYQRQQETNGRRISVATARAELCQQGEISDAP